MIKTMFASCMLVNTTYGSNLLKNFVNEQLAEFADENQAYIQEYLDQTVSDFDDMWTETTEQLELNPVYEFATKKGPGVICVQRHCSNEEAACLADQVCRENFSCAGQCDPTDSACTFICSESYKSESVDNLMHCMFQEYECLELPPPSPENNATCREPFDAVVDGINNAYASGEWYMQYGFNDQYDCFECQLLAWEFPFNQQIRYEAIYDLTAVNGTTIWNDVVMHGEEETPGVMTLKGFDSGFENTQYFYFLVNEIDTQMIYYCGDLMTWHFEGTLIMSKNPSELNPMHIPLITEKLAMLGMKWEDLCELHPEQDCKNIPSLN